MTPFIVCVCLLLTTAVVFYVFYLPGTPQLCSAVTVVKPVSLPIVIATVTGFVKAVRLTPRPSALKVKLLLPSGVMRTSRFTPLITPSNSNLPFLFMENDTGGISTQNVPICSATCSETGLIPLVLAARVKCPVNSKPVCSVTSRLAEKPENIPASTSFATA